MAHPFLDNIPTSPHEIELSGPDRPPVIGKVLLFIIKTDEGEVEYLVVESAKHHT